MLRNVFLATLIIWVATAIIGGPIAVNEIALLVALVTGAWLAVRWLRSRFSREPAQAQPPPD